MKPTQEQVIAWAREAGDCFRDSRGREEFSFDFYGIERFAALAYEAGRKDENEACAEIAAWILKMSENDVSAAIRARIKP